MQTNSAKQGNVTKPFYVTCIRVVQVNKNKTNLVALVRKRTIPTERLPLVGEVNANFTG
jgi:hypothetical protein